MNKEIIKLLKHIVNEDNAIEFLHEKRVLNIFIAHDRKILSNKIKIG